MAGGFSICLADAQEDDRGENVRGVRAGVVERVGGGQPDGCVAIGDDMRLNGRRADVLAGAQMRLRGREYRTVDQQEHVGFGFIVAAAVTAAVAVAV